MERRSSHPPSYQEVIAADPPSYEEAISGDEESYQNPPPVLETVTVETQTTAPPSVPRYVSQNSRIDYFRPKSSTTIPLHQYGARQEPVSARSRVPERLHGVFPLEMTCPECQQNIVTIIRRWPVDRVVSLFLYLGLIVVSYILLIKKVVLLCVITFFMAIFSVIYYGYRSCTRIHYCPECGREVGRYRNTSRH